MDPLNQTSQTPLVEQAPATSTKSGMGALIGAIIVIALLIFGGLYFYGMKLKQDAALQPTAEFKPAPVAEQPLSPSDDVAAISADAEADAAYMAQLEADIDADLKAIESY
jgi:uncharacterized protein HemX